MEATGWFEKKLIKALPTTANNPVDEEGLIQHHQFWIVVFDVLFRIALFKETMSPVSWCSVDRTSCHSLVVLQGYEE